MKKNINYGLAVLKSILAFYVIRSHCLPRNSTKNAILFYILVKRRNIHVPSFFIMSFFFNYKCFISNDTKRKVNRFERIIIPYIFWPFIIFPLNFVFGKFFKLKLEYSIKKLIFQLILGRGIINPLWFQLDLILTTFLFYVIIYIFQYSYLYVLQLIMIISYILQYSEYNLHAFAHSISELKYSLGREIMMIPLAVTGFILGSSNAIYYIKEYRIKTTISALIIFISVDYFNIFSDIGEYNGIKLNVLSICLIFIFSLFPFENIKNEYIKKFFDYITRYTAGIFYLHIEVYYILNNFIISIKKQTVQGLLIIYIITYSICHFGILVFGKTKAKHLFS